MRTIWKYKINSSLKIEVPKGGKILSVGTQDNDICVWAVVNPKEEELEEIHFKLLTTGEEFPPIPETWYFLATVQVNIMGRLAFHVFVIP